MATQVTNYQCPACTGPLHFSSSTGKLQCEYCGKSFSVDEIEALYKQKDAKAAEAFDAGKNTSDENAQAAPEAGESPEYEPTAHAKSKWDESTISDDWGADTENMRSYNCPSCGAELMCEAATAATQCPYCGNPSIVPGQFGGSLKPDYVIPFRLDKQAAMASLKKHYRKKLFLPSTFSSGNAIEKIQGIYVPFWLFSATARAECTFHATNSTTHRSGDYRITTTRHYDVQRKGNVRFERIPADASKKMPDDLMDSIEPFNYSELKPFSTAYLPGYVADKYDVSIAQSSERADRRCTNSAVDVMRSDVSGYQTIVNKSSRVSIDRGTVHYALLPIWILTTKWQDKNYIFAMNGQTGKFIGDLPVSKRRYWAWFAGVAAAVAAAVYFSGLANYIAGLFL